MRKMEMIDDIMDVVYLIVVLIVICILTTIPLWSKILLLIVGSTSILYIVKSIIKEIKDEEKNYEK